MPSTSSQFVNRLNGRAGRRGKPHRSAIQVVTQVQQVVVARGHHRGLPVGQGLKAWQYQPQARAQGLAVMVCKGMNGVAKPHHRATKGPIHGLIVVRARPAEAKVHGPQA